MIGFLASRFIKDYQNTSDAAVRRAYGVLCGAVGIVINLLLFALKLFAGTLAGSVAVTADAFNNLSDAGASIVTLLGFRLAGQKPDPEHPFGHGRLEYISGLIVSIVILLMGFELLRDAVGAILHPEAVECSVLTVAILLVSICAKFYMYCYNRGVGKKISAAAMQATAADSLSDCAATAAVLLATLAGYFLHWQIDGWCGLVVSLLILWAGVQAARDTLSPLLGQPPSEEFVQEIRDIVMESQVVCGIHDLVVHDYGPGHQFASIHVELPAEQDPLEAHDLIDNIERNFMKNDHLMVTIHYDPIVTSDAAVGVLRTRLTEKLRQLDPALSLHDLRIVPGKTHTNVLFDLVLPAGYAGDKVELLTQMEQFIKEQDPTYNCIIKLEQSYTAAAHK